MIFSAASALPSDLRMILMISSSASKTVSKPFEQVDALLERGELVLETLGHHLEPEMEEVPEDLLDVEPLGPADFGILGRDQAGQVDREVDLERRVLEEVRHDHLLVGVLLHLDRDAHVFGRQVLHVEQRRQLAADARPRRSARPAAPC